MDMNMNKTISAAVNANKAVSKFKKTLLKRGNEYKHVSAF